MDADDYIAIKSRISAEIKRKNYEYAHDLISEALKIFPYDSDLLVKKYICSWFAASGETVEDVAETTLALAGKLCPDSARNQIELGFHCYSVTGETERAEVCFRKAKSLAFRRLSEAYLGLIKIAVDGGDSSMLKELADEINLLSEEVRDYCTINSDANVFDELADFAKDAEN